MFSILHFMHIFLLTLPDVRIILPHLHSNGTSSSITPLYHNPPKTRLIFKRAWHIYFLRFLHPFFEFCFLHQETSFLCGIFFPYFLQYTLFPPFFMVSKARPAYPSGLIMGHIVWYGAHPVVATVITEYSHILYPAPKVGTTTDTDTS